MSVMVATGRGAMAGVLIRDAQALELMEQVRVLMTDKTGTVTLGHPEMTAVACAPGFKEADVIQWAASVDQHSEHPIAAAIVRAAKQRGLQCQPATGFAVKPGEGVHAQIQGHDIHLGRAAWLRAAGIVTDLLAHTAQPWQAQGATVVFLAVDRRVAAALAVMDPIKPTAADAVHRLREERVKLIMVTGDHPATAQAVADRLGIDEVHAGLLPEQKQQLVRQFQSAGHRVAMAGDGINDAPALAQADVGIAMGTGTDVAIQAARITLVKGDLAGIWRARRLSRATMRNIRQNLFLAFVYNTLGVPIAAGVLYPAFGWTLSPIVASAAMTLSSVSVILNALRLRRLAF
jgi:Cu+-exporting ATPase